MCKSASLNPVALRSGIQASPTYASFVKDTASLMRMSWRHWNRPIFSNFLILAIECVMDMDAYHAELEEEKKDAVGIAAAKNMVVEFLKTSGIGPQ